MPAHKQKVLRFSADQRLLLDTLRQYLGTTSETEAGAAGLRVLAEQLAATYLMTGIEPMRCEVLIATMNATAMSEEGVEHLVYTVDERRQLLRWHQQSGTYKPISPAVADWLPVAMARS